MKIPLSAVPRGHFLDAFESSHHGCDHALRWIESPGVNNSKMIEDLWFGVCQLFRIVTVRDRMQLGPNGKTTIKRFYPRSRHNGCCRTFGQQFSLLLDYFEARTRRYLRIPASALTTVRHSNQKSLGAYAPELLCPNSQFPHRWAPPSESNEHPSDAFSAPFGSMFPTTPAIPHIWYCYNRVTGTLRLSGRR